MYRVFYLQMAVLFCRIGFVSNWEHWGHIISVQWQHSGSLFPPIRLSSSWLLSKSIKSLKFLQFSPCTTRKVLKFPFIFLTCLSIKLLLHSSNSPQLSYPLNDLYFCWFSLQFFVPTCSIFTFNLQMSAISLKFCFFNCRVFYLLLFFERNHETVKQQLSCSFLSHTIVNIRRSKKVGFW